VLADGLKKIQGPSLLVLALEKLAKVLIVLPLLPILIPLILILIVKSLFEAIREYLKTGKWPRNEAFIARMKKKREQEKAR
jgi:hypothetical protein